MADVQVATLQIGKCAYKHPMAACMCAMVHVFTQGSYFSLVMLCK